METHELYGALVESSEDGIVAKDLAGNVILWNPAAERLFGYSAGEMIGHSIRRLLPDDRQHEEDAILARIRAGQKVEQFFTKRLHKSGRLIDVSVAISPIHDSNQQIAGASKNVRDATDIVDAQRQLEKSARRFRMLADNISQFAWIARPDGHVYWYNKRWYDYTGATPEDMDGWGWQAIHHPDHLERVTTRLRQCFESGEEWEDIFPLRGADGSYRWFLSRAMPIRDEAGNITDWFGTNTDITEQREQAEQIRLLLGEVNHRSKNMLATVQAIARRTASADAAFIEQFEKRIAGLSVNQDILVRREWREVPLDELVTLQLRFLGKTENQLEVKGPELHLKPRAAETIGMALHELATNSIKYGALSVEDGRVGIGWAVDPEGGFTMWWEESGGPPVSPPDRTGFGTILIRDIPRSLGADVTLDYAPGGVKWTLACDITLLEAVHDQPVV